MSDNNVIDMDTATVMKAGQAIEDIQVLIEQAIETAPSEEALNEFLKEAEKILAPVAESLTTLSAQGGYDIAISDIKAKIKMHERAAKEKSKS